MRFPGFEGEWETKKIKDLGDFIGGGTPDTNNQNFWIGTIPWISSSDIIIDDIHNISKTRFITEEAIKSSATKLISKGGILMVSRVGIGKFAVADEELCTSQDFTNLITTENEYFLCYYFNARSNDFIKLSQGTSIKGFTTQDIKSAIFFIPSIEEQQKIASFLSLIDERIQTQNKIIKQLETLIKGLSEKLFSQKIRFKEFTDEWELKTLVELCKKAKSGGTPRSTVKEYYDGNIPFLSISDMTEQGKYLYSTEKTISIKGLKNSTSWLVPIDSIIYSMYASVGFVSINKIELATSQAVLNLIPKSDICTEYLYYYLVYFQKFVNRYITTGTQGNLNAETVKNFEINLPTLQEQTDIAQLLSFIDTKLQTEKNLLSTYQSQKQYLLQNLFI